MSLNKNATWSKFANIIDIVMKRTKERTIEPLQVEHNIMPNAASIGLDQSAHPRSVIGISAVR